MSDNVEDDNQAFVIYVPPNNGDNTYESCLRLGAGPTTTTADERKTFDDLVSAANALSGLSSSTYKPNHGIALLTPGTVNVLAAGGVNTTCGSYTHSNIGDSYVVTQDVDSKNAPTEIISATYTSRLGPVWATTSFNQAVTVSTNTVPLQASIVLGPTYSVSGPISLTNNWGATWSSMAGFSVTAQLARVTNIGLHTIVVTDFDGSSNQYYTVKQAASNAAGFSWSVPVVGKAGSAGLWSYEQYDKLQDTWCKVVNGAAVATDLIAVVYAAAGAGIANNGTPQSVQTWLIGSEAIAITCTALDGLLCVGGILLGYLFVDTQAKETNEANWGATQISMGDGSIELTTATPSMEGEPPKPGPDPLTPKVTIDRTKGITLTTPNNRGGATITLNGNTVTMKTPGATITMQDDNVTIEATTITLSGQVKLKPPSPVNAPTTPQSIGLSGEGLPGGGSGEGIPVNWGAPNWPPSK